jgi:hypothetical protein
MKDMSLQDYLTLLFIVTVLATLVSARTTFLAWFKPDKLRQEIEGRSKILTDVYPTTIFWRNASVNKIRFLTSMGFILIILTDIILYAVLFWK